MGEQGSVWIADLGKEECVAVAEEGEQGEAFLALECGPGGG